MKTNGIGFFFSYHCSFFSNCPCMMCCCFTGCVVLFLQKPFFAIPSSHVPFLCFFSFRSNNNNIFSEVVRLNFEIASFSSLSGTQPISWQVEYPQKKMTEMALSEIFICQKDLVGIVPLAMVRDPEFPTRFLKDLLYSCIAFRGMSKFLPYLS